VVLAHRDQLAEIRDVVLDPASQTSVALLRYLLHQRGLAPKLVEGSTRDGVIGHGVGRLLIGDQALRFRRDQPEVSVWDLGAAWQAVAALPFVYALWLVRPEVNNAGEIATRLRQIRNANMAELASIAGEEDEFDSAFLTRYYTHHLRFNFADRDKRGLQAFADACANLGLLPKREFALNLV